MIAYSNDINSLEERTGGVGWGLERGKSSSINTMKYFEFTEKDTHLSTLPVLVFLTTTYECTIFGNFVTFTGH